MKASSHLFASALVALSMTGCVVVVTEEPVTLGNKMVPRVQLPQTQKTTPAYKQILYVDPVEGTDNPTVGQTETQPLQTITYALKQSNPGTVIQLAPGEYSAQTGEIFPLELKAGVTLRGNEAQQGEGVKIIGGGDYLSRTWAKQNVTIVAAEKTEIAGVTVTNRNRSGTAIWVESTAPTIRNSRLVNSDREGIFVTGNAAPRIENNRIADNGGNGISLTHNTAGEIRGNQIENTGFGLAIGGDAAPLVADNQIRNNLDGLVITHSARPILRGNAIVENQRDGLVAISESQPDLGTATAEGNNMFANNGRYDVQNAAKQQNLVAVGNQLTGDRVLGVQLQ
ncbi:DUF1565 domain-containing protein [Phormidium sp. CCY1219]|uniref:DUF1565 domain-containing protein n=1 Tax=Phormidium sp. CCY1219 TaxID=2886104 RepID=UPI002D1E5D4B|nr:DUF1565 domain-containing protein [Phormidium sp. CCY1219]MEB3830525.1 DUF1565 domain-containing protein [Phormidium sp. CCY1219]